jgi:serine/threonine-protein kinase HipA
MNLYCDEKLVGSMRPYFANWRLEFSRNPAVPLSPHFQCSKGVVLESEAVNSFFINYLPEEPYAQHVAARIKPYPRSMEDWFAALGQELTGAYALTPFGTTLSAAQYISLPVDTLAEGMQSSRLRADAIAFTLDHASALPRLSLAGAQDKFALWFDPRAKEAAQRFKIPHGRAASTHIFKPASTDARYPMLPANEYACAQLARVVGLSVANTAVTSIGGVRTLVSERFDRQRRGQQVRRIHQIDMCQLLNLPRERKYGSHNAGIDTEDFFKACDHLAVPALARRAHLRAWLFNFLIGNQDAHAKNYSFLYQNGWQTAPLYDLLCVVPYLPEQTLSMGLLGEYRPGWFERAHWLELARLAGVTAAYLAVEVADMVQRVQAAAVPLAKLLRGQLDDDELGFLSERVNPVVAARAKYLQDAAVSLRLAN